jgi:hypothetical protein
MELEDLIAEGRALMRPTVLLRASGGESIAARWYGLGAYEVDEDDFPCWLTVDCQYIPNWISAKPQYLSLFTNKDCLSGYVALTDDWPDREGVDLYAHTAEVLPPIEAVFARGSQQIDDWLAANNWKREWGWNDWFGRSGGLPGPNTEIAYHYIRQWQSECPLYLPGVYAALGGWHSPGPDTDWHDLIDEHLCVLTVEDAEPWVEAWQMSDGTFRVIQRIT